MSAGNSIIGDCADCCNDELNCPEALSKYKSRSKTNCAFDPGGLGQYYKTQTTTYDFAWSDSGSAGTATNGCPGPATSYVHSASGSATSTCTATSGGHVCGPLTGSASVSLLNNAYGGDCGPSDCGFAVVTSISQSWPFGSTGSETIDITYKPCTGGTNSSVTNSFSADFDDYGYPYSTSVAYTDLTSSAGLRLTAIEELGSYPSDWSTGSGSASYEEYDSGDTHCVTVSDSIYQLAFKVPTQGLCYRANWVERFISKNGSGIDSIEIISSGVYRPTVTASGSRGCVLVASMSSSGAVTAINILNPGYGYLQAPIITVQSAINGGTTSTGWTATISGGQVVSVTGGSGGNYLPTVSFSGGDGSGAAASVTLDSQGGLATVSVSASGSGYVSEPSISIQPKVSGSTPSTFFIHMGTEAAKCSSWNGSIPEDYDPEDVNTWPTLPPGGGYLTFSVPSSEGTTTIANIRATCDCVSCT